ncbi:MAG TPA: Gfo/Idh/MocA family oxidoreductase [Dermatophilaceae bacterium]
MPKLRVGMIGAGGVSHSHAPHWVALGAEVRVYALVGADRLAARYGLTEVGTLEQLFLTSDVIDVCTTTVTHRELALAAIGAGKNVLCEKPLGRTLEDARVIAAAARAADVQVYPAHVVRFFPEYAAMHGAVAQGKIGRPAVLRFTRGGEGPTSDWFYDEAQSGGIILDLMIHDLDQARWIAGDVVQVYAVQNPPTLNGSIPRNVVVHITLTHLSGAISHIQGIWGPGGTGTSFEVSGDAGVLSFDSGASGTIVENLCTPEIGTTYLPPASAEESPYLTELREFAAAFQCGPEPRVCLDDGVVAVALAEAAQESIASGFAISFDASALVAAREPAL